MQKYIYILLVELMGCISLMVLSVWQFCEIGAKEARLNEYKNSLVLVENQIKDANDLLQEVSSEDYKELTARKKGFGVEGEVSFIAK